MFTTSTPTSVWTNGYPRSYVLLRTTVQSCFQDTNQVSQARKNESADERLLLPDMKAPQPMGTPMGMLHRLVKPMATPYRLLRLC